MVVSNVFYFHPYLGIWSNLTHIFQMGWFNHQLAYDSPSASSEDERSHSESLESSPKKMRMAENHETTGRSSDFFCCTKVVKPGSPCIHVISGLGGCLGYWPSFFFRMVVEAFFSGKYFLVFRDIPQEASSCRRNGRSSMLPHNCCPDTLERRLISLEQRSKSF